MLRLTDKTWRLTILLAACATCATPALSFYERPGITATEIIKARGYTTRDVYLTTQDGYRLHLVHATNPLISQSQGKARVPILFIHGIVSDSNVFVINSFDVEPRDLSQANLSDVDAIAQEPSAYSLPLLALNFGHEVWLLDRRSAPPSQTGTSRDGVGSGNEAQSAHRIRGQATPLEALISSLSTFTDISSAALKFPQSFGSYWDFSYDEQIEIDFPLVLDYVSEQSGGSRVAIVAHSAGGMITLSALSERPELANKISSAIFWAEAYSLGRGDRFSLLAPLLPFFETYIGSIPPAFSTPAMQALLDLVCSTELTQKTLCEPLADLFLGDSGGQEPITPQFINSLQFPSSSHEIAQSLQGSLAGGFMHKFDYGSREANMAKYNQTEPPLYDLSRVTLERIAFYVGRTDGLATEQDVRQSASLLTVPHKLQVIDTTFNHQGYFYHNDAARLAIIPSLQDIHRFSESD